MNGRITIIAITLCVTMVICCSDKTIYDPPPGFVVGKVVDADSDLGIDSVMLSLRFQPDTLTSPSSMAVSDSSGYYRLFAGYNQGRVYVLATKEGFLPGISDAHLSKYDTVVVNLSLIRRE